jgi:hypothetical protein
VTWVEHGRETRNEVTKEERIPPAAGEARRIRLLGKVQGEPGRCAPARSTVPAFEPSGGTGRLTRRIFYPDLAEVNTWLNWVEGTDA